MIQSCHSEESGKVFFQAGIDHVICVRQEKQIDEVACHIFANSFYTYLFKSQLSICQAFDQAKHSLKRGPPGEFPKFIIYRKCEQA